MTTPAESSVTHDIPRSPASARAMLPWYEERCRHICQRIVEMKRELDRARGELCIVQAVAAGEYEDAGTYAIGSHGAWRVDDTTRYVLTPKGRAALSLEQMPNGEHAWLRAEVPTA